MNPHTSSQTPRPLLLTALVVLFAAQFLRAAEPAAVVSVDAASAVVTARVESTGQGFQFSLGNPTLLRQLHPGSPLSADLTAKFVSIPGSPYRFPLVLVAASPGPAGGPAPAPPPPPGGPTPTGGSSGKPGAKPTVSSKSGGSADQPGPDSSKINAQEGSTAGAIRGVQLAPTRAPLAAPFPFPIVSNTKEIDPCTVATADTLRTLLSAGLKGYFPVSVSKDGRHIKVDPPTLDGATCPHFSIRASAHVQYRVTQGFPQFETGGDLRFTSPIVVRVSHNGLPEQAVTASNLREANAILTDIQITHLSIDNVPSWLDLTWIKQCFNGQHSEWGCRDLAKQMSFPVTDLVRLYLQQGHSL